MALSAQTGAQAPQSMHRSGLMSCWPLRAPLIASTGHRFTQAVHPVQSSLMTKVMGRVERWHPRCSLCKSSVFREGLQDRASTADDDLELHRLRTGGLHELGDLL